MTRTATANLYKGAQGDAQKGDELNQIVDCVDALSTGWARPAAEFQYVSPTQFKVIGYDARAGFAVGATVMADLNGIKAYSVVSDASYLNPDTTVTLASSILTSSLSWAAWTTNRGVLSEHLPAEAIRSARVVYDTDNSINIEFPFVFADGTSWSSISAFSTAATGKPNGSIFWGAVYLDASKNYRPGSGPTADDIAVAWSSSDVTAPSHVSGGIKLATYFRGKGNAGGGCDLCPFTAQLKKYTRDNLIQTPVYESGAESMTSVPTSIAKHVPITAEFVIGRWVANIPSFTGNAEFYLQFRDANNNAINVIYSTTYVNASVAYMEFPVEFKTTELQTWRNYNGCIPSTSYSRFYVHGFKEK